MSKFEQPTMFCPKCHREYADFDGFGVVFCPPSSGGCGFCRHVARTGGVCDFCQNVKAEKGTRE